MWFQWFCLFGGFSSLVYILSYFKSLSHSSPWVKMDYINFLLCFRGSSPSSMKLWGFQLLCSHTAPIAPRSSENGDESPVSAFPWGRPPCHLRHCFLRGGAPPIPEAGVLTLRASQARCSHAMHMLQVKFFSVFAPTATRNWKNRVTIAKPSERFIWIYTPRERRATVKVDKGTEVSGRRLIYHILVRTCLFDWQGGATWFTGPSMQLPSQWALSFPVRRCDLGSAPLCPRWDWLHLKSLCCLHTGPPPPG